MPDPTPETILAGCDEEQRAAITTDAAPLLVVAGAGSGKTRVLSRRIAWRVTAGTAAGERSLALTFTRKAAHELRARLLGLGLSDPVPSGTFHSVALSELRRRAIDQGHALPIVADNKHRLLDRVVPRAAGARRGALLSEIAAEIEWSKARRVTPAQYVTVAAGAGRRPGHGLAEVAEVYAAYEDVKRRRGVLDLDDLLDRLTVGLRVDPDFAAASRWRYRHLFIDELQDANASQLALLDAWLGDSNDVFAVGDARQSIYGWNGADPAALDRFAKVHPGTTRLELTANYRSDPAIVHVAGAILADRSQRAMRAATGANPTVTAHSDADAEAAAVAAAILDARAHGRPWGECAVLARTNALLEPVAAALSRVGIPVRPHSARPFLERPAIERLLAAVRGSGDPARFRSWLEGLARHTRNLAEDADDGVHDDEAALFGFATEYAALEPAPNGRGFVGYLDEAAVESGSGSDSAGGVDLLTFHRAKGLEWESVWAIGLEDGYVPITHARSTVQLDEERRLLYVAVTRARETLACSWAESRAFGARVVERDRSPYLDGFVAALAELPPASHEPDRAARRAIAASRASLSRAQSR